MPRQPKPDLSALPAANRPAPGRSGRQAITRPKADVLPALETDLSRADLPVLPSVDSQARALNWFAAEVRSVDQDLDLYGRLPQRCAGACCPLAGSCPTAPSFAFTGEPCPVEQRLIYRHLVALVRQLGLQPDEHLDLLLAADLIRMEVTLRRTDLQLAAEGLLVDEVAGVIQKSCEPVYNRAAHPLVAIQESLRRERERLLKQLLASRETKGKLAAEREKADTTVRGVMQRLQEVAAEYERQQLEAKGIDTSSMTQQELRLRGLPGFGPEETADHDEPLF